MRFYHCFFTDLPDEFVQANADRLIKWADGWKDKNRYYRRSMIVDTVPLDFFGNAKKEDWPRLVAQSKIMLAKWMQTNGGKYDGGYWGTLTEDQRDPNRAPGNTGGNASLAAATLASWIRPGAIYPIPSASPSTLTAAHLNAMRQAMIQGTWSEFLDSPKPPLKRDGVVAGEIVGYRCWRIERGLLRSVYQTDVWQPGQTLEGRELGDWDSRGIHAWKDSGSKQYHDYIRGYLNRADDPGMVWVMMNGSPSERNANARPAMVTGTVFLWGDVVEHERGWRAEYARVRSLDWLYPDETMMGREQKALDDLRGLYAVTSTDRK